jgi:peptidyl-prolyl cis-trans isomerase C
VHRASIEATVGSPIDKAAPDAIDAALVGLVSTARQAAAAHAAGLQTDPRVQAELEVARQRVLARAWRRHAGQTVHEEAIASRFEGQKEALTERIYDLDFIRVPIKDGDRIAALNQARTAYAQLRDGTPFTQVARRFSQDGPSKTRGGHLGKVEGRRLPVPVRQKLDELAVGTPTPPIELKDAVVVARLRSKVIVQPPQLAHFAPRLRAELHNEAQALDEAILAERFPIKMRGKGGVQ